MVQSEVSVDQLCINTIRTLSMDMVQKANSGHPGLPMGAAPMAYVLWTRHLKHNPADPGWYNRDRFVLSAGHGSALIYSLLHLTGYAVSIDDIKNFRQWGSITPGHPEYLDTPGLEATTGPLGQGSSNAVGMAIAERMLAHRFNRPGNEIVDHYTFALVSDGDLMEGISCEAGSLAGHLKLGKLIYLYDANDVTLDGPASLCFDSEDVGKRYEAYGWQVLQVQNGDTDIDAIDKAITDAKNDTSRPSIIIIKTTIGYGSPNKAGKSDAHGSPLGEEEVALTKKNLGWDYTEPFTIPDGALSHFRSALEKGASLQSEWEENYDSYSSEFPDLSAAWESTWNLDLPDGWEADLPTWKPGDSEATRVSGGKALNAIAKNVEWLVGGDADLSGSTKTNLKGAGSFDGQSGEGRNIHFGVREHAMAGICNGISYHGGLRPFCSTFLVFSDYMRPSIRLAALNKLPVIYVWTHDSIAVGEDGPTHQPVEHYMALRTIPNLKVFRPADPTETAASWKWIMGYKDGPVALILTRQNMKAIDRSVCAPAENVEKGGYILRDSENPKAIIFATGSEVQLALDAHDKLLSDGINARVVSMPCWGLFLSQPDEYQKSVIPPDITARVSVEAGITGGWHRFVGPSGISIGIDRYGASAPGEVNMEKFGFTVDAVIKAVKNQLK
ncbi:MAG TPA: transketolase [bacterium]|jgi:transketolase